MKRKLFIASIVAFFVIALSSCSLEEFASMMGKNVLKQEVKDVNASAESQSADELAKENKNLSTGLKIIAGKEDLTDITVVSPLSSSDIDDLKKNYSSAEGKKELESLKEKSTDLTADDIKGIKGTAEIINNYVKDIDTSSMEDGTLKELVSNLKETTESLVNNPENAKQGDIIALKYTLSLLEEIPKAIDDKDLRITKDGTEIKVESKDIINALFGKENKAEKEGDPVFELSDVGKLLENEGSEKAVSDVVVVVESYLNIVSVASNFTGNVDVGSLINSFMGSSNK